MKQILQSISRYTRKLTQNRLFTEWIENPAIEPEDKLTFVPLALDFIMGFRDLNKYFIKYENPQNALEISLNNHADEDETHSGLLLKDWLVLGLDQKLGWKASDLYWWLTSDYTLESRRADFELTTLVYHNPDPFLRFAIIEAMENAGKVFFKRTVPIAKALAAKTGADYPYFGEYHLHREDGHLQNTDERIFTKATLTSEQQEKAELLVAKVFEIFEFHFNSWEKLARAVYEKRWQFEAETEGLQKAALRSDRPQHLTQYSHLSYPVLAEVKANINTAELIRIRTVAFDELWQTPFYKWIREAPNGAFREILRQTWLQWIVDNWACADYFIFDTSYGEPKTALERGINRLSLLFASEMNRRYAEWKLLDLDEYTGWTASQALEHYWLDELVEEQRAIFADLRKLTFRYPKPLHRYWIMKCFVRFGDALMHSLGIALRNSADNEEDFIILAGAPERIHPDLPADAEADRAIAELELQPVTVEDFAIIGEIIKLTKEQESRRAALGWRVIQEKRFEHLAEAWKNKLALA